MANQMPNTFEVEQAIAAQIATEQSLTSTRMTWNLTFQGFMMAAFALVAAADFTQPARYFLELVACFSGAAIAHSTFIGVRASERQRDYLKNHWRTHVAPQSLYPRPFSDTENSRNGRTPATRICWTLIAMWVVMAVGVMWVYFASDQMALTK